MKLIIAGGRDFNNYNLLKKEILNIIKDLKGQIIIISGTAKGADSLGEIFAKEFQLKIERYPAQWCTHGRSAGFQRNKIMAKNADILIAFWDGSSRGTANMIQIAKMQKLIIHIIKYNKDN